MVDSAVPFDRTSACVSWRANSQCNTRSCTSTTPQEPHSYSPPSLLYPRHDEPSHVISDEGPSSTPNTESFTYPTSPVYTAPIYHQRQLHGWLFEWARNINQAHPTGNTEIRCQKPASSCVWSEDPCLG